MRRSSRRSAILALALCAACAEDTRDGAAAIDPARAVAPSPAAPSAPARSGSAAPWLGAHEARTDDARYLVRWRADHDPIPEGEPFAIDAWVFDAAKPDAPLDDVALDVDAGMPQHGHGMSALARVGDAGAGAWRAEGLRFHMAGSWQLAFDVTRGARTDRARAEVVLE